MSKIYAVVQHDGKFIVYDSLRIASKAYKANQNAAFIAKVLKDRVGYFTHKLPNSLENNAQVG